MPCLGETGNFQFSPTSFLPTVALMHPGHHYKGDNFMAQRSTKGIYFTMMSISFCPLLLHVLCFFVSSCTSRIPPSFLHRAPPLVLYPLLPSITKGTKYTWRYKLASTLGRTLQGSKPTSDRQNTFRGSKATSREELTGIHAWKNTTRE